MDHQMEWIQLKNSTEETEVTWDGSKESGFEVLDIWKKGKVLLYLYVSKVSCLKIDNNQYCVGCKILDKHHMHWLEKLQQSIWWI